MTKRGILEKIEDAGHYYNGELRRGGSGTYWVDNKAGMLYECESDDPDFSSASMTDIEILELFESGTEL